MNFNSRDGGYVRLSGHRRPLVLLRFDPFFGNFIRTEVVEKNCSQQGIEQKIV